MTEKGIRFTTIRRYEGGEKNEKKRWVTIEVKKWKSGNASGG